MSVVLFKKKFINTFLKIGRKVAAEELFFEMLAHLKFKASGASLKKFYDTLVLLSPIIDFRAVKKGGIVYRMPIAAKFNSAKSLKLVNMWLLKTTYTKTKTIKFQSLLANILDTLQKKGLAYEQKMALYKSGVDNRPFLKFNRKINKGWRFVRKLRRMRSHAKWVRRNVLKFRRYKLGMQSRRSRMDRFIKSKIDADVNRRLRYQPRKKALLDYQSKMRVKQFWKQQA